MTAKLAEYLFARLAQLGVHSVHGVPGDYNLNLLDYIEPAGLHWVGNTNELNAGYAADGYARIKGMGAIVTTFGVGELSAVNAIAGAYAERAAVVHIVGTPDRAIQDSRALAHHTLNDGDFRRFGQMHAHITVAQASLRDPRTSPAQLDEVLRQCLLHSRPVYIEIPQDLVAAPVPAAGLKEKVLAADLSSSPGLNGAVAMVLDKIQSARRPIILVDGETRAIGIVEEVQKLSKSTSWPTWTTSFGKSLLDETQPNFHGVYRGRFAEPVAQDFFSKSDLILCFGPHFSSTNTFLYSSIPDQKATISFTDTEMKVGQLTFRDIPAKAALCRLLERIDLSKARSYDPYPSLPHDRILSFSAVPSLDGQITQDLLWPILASFLRSGDIVLGETGTSGYGIRHVPLPLHTHMFAPATWLSIGYMLPAAQGAALAQRELVTSDSYHGIVDPRTILFIGDGSLQMTVQELSTIVKKGLDMVVFVINNDGYTVERCIHGLNEKYNDVAGWRYMLAPAFFGARDDSYTATVRTWGELKKVLEDERLISGKGLRMVEVLLDREDVPSGPLFGYLEKERTRINGMAIE